MEVPQIVSFTKNYRFLSNFSHSPFSASLWLGEGPEFGFQTVEHYYQANKTINLYLAKEIIAARTPRRAKSLGRRVTLRPGWEGIKHDVMLTGVREKFKQNPELAARLVATGDATLIEGNTWNDRYWGCSPVKGADGIRWVGENYLGQMLMIVRQEIR
jgi:ribA/ribD-fused uncharacterized protein